MTESLSVVLWQMYHWILTLSLCEMWSLTLKHSDSWRQCDTYARIFSHYMWHISMGILWESHIWMGILYMNGNLTYEWESFDTTCDTNEWIFSHHNALTHQGSVTHIHTWHTFICDTHSYVTHIHMWHTFICDTHLYWHTPSLLLLPNFLFPPHNALHCSVRGPQIITSEMWCLHISTRA